MAASSSTTLLQAVNHVLHDIGERQVTAIASPISRQVEAAIKEAVYEISTIDDWEWSREYVTASSWSGDTANLTDVVRIHGVSYGDTTNGYRDVRFVDTRVFDRKPIVAFTASQGYAPGAFTIVNDGQVRLNPYPSDAESQAKVRFYVTTELTPPSLPTSVFPLPERAMLLVYKRAAYLMAIRHLGDPGMAAQYQNELEAHAQRMRSRERLAPTGHSTMYRRGRGSW